MPYACRRCNHEDQTPWEGQCPGCGGFYRARRVGADSDEPGGSTLGSGRGATAAKSRISTGLEGLDYVLDGGLLAGRTVLLGGFAGTGKTNMLIRVADHIGKTQGSVLYASGEESASDINGYAAHLGVVNDRVHVLGNQSTVEDVLAQAKKLRAFLVIYDSAQEFVSRHAGGSSGSTAQCKAIGKAIKVHCGETKTCAIVVNQMTGEGTLKGGTELEHQCDAVCVLAFPKEDDPDAPGLEADGYRCLYNQNKNRGGVANRKSYWRMNDETGVLEYAPAKSKIVDAKGRYRKKIWE